MGYADCGIVEGGTKALLAFTQCSISAGAQLDLLAIDNPRRIAGFPSVFTFPFITPEAVWQVDAHSLIVVNDNNYPEAGARSPDVRDDTEFIKVAF